MKCRHPFIALLAVGLFRVSLGAADDHLVVPLWPAGAPGFEIKKDTPEKVMGTNISNIQNPSLTVYLPPKTSATGAAVIVVPGGGHQRLAFQHEGTNVAQWLADHGIAAFILKYRLSKDEGMPEGTSPYSVDVHELGDAQRALRLVRSRASEWGVSADRVGMVGFSAGGEVTLLAATRPKEGDPTSSDGVERQSARPDFVGLLYPGGLQRTDFEITKGCPPVFLACGADDRPTIAEMLPDYYLKFKRAGVPVELHIFAGSGHGFGIRASNTAPSGTWPDRFRDWMRQRKLLGEK